MQILRRRLAPSLSQRHTKGDKARIEKALTERYWIGFRAYTGKALTDDRFQHLSERLRIDRTQFTPWLNSLKPLDGARILEIGCGTGSSTVALAEQGAIVTGVDIDEDALYCARERCAAHGVTARFLSTNIDTFDLDQPYDFVIFFACLEHMKHGERLAALKRIWEQMKPGTLLVVLDTPNRLWYFDDHTSRLNFWNWLPDDLALAYAKFSNRTEFRNRFIDQPMSDELMDLMLRRGRGVSYHEFDLAIGIGTYRVTSTLTQYRGVRGTSADRQYKRLLRTVEPTLQAGFDEPTLNLAIAR